MVLTNLESRFNLLFKVSCYLFVDHYLQDPALEWLSMVNEAAGQILYGTHEWGVGIKDRINNGFRFLVDQTGYFKSKYINRFLPFEKQYFDQSRGLLKTISCFNITTNSTKIGIKRVVSQLLKGHINVITKRIVGDNEQL